MSLESRLTAACVCDWIHTVVVPKWKLPTIRTHQSLGQIERHMVLQAGKGTCGPWTEPHNATEENQLFFPVKITCEAVMIEGIPSRKQPYVIGVEGFDQLLPLYLNPIANKVPVPIVDRVRHNEWINRTAGKRHVRWVYKDPSAILLCKSTFKNALGDSTGCQGFKYTNSLGSICVFSKYRLIAFEYYTESPTPSGHVKAVGGINILFVNPRHSVNAIRLLQTILQNTEAFEYKEHPLYLMKRFCQLMTMFLFPTKSVHINLKFDVGQASEIEEYIGIFHPENHSEITDMPTATSSSFEIFCYKTTSSDGNFFHVNGVKHVGKKYELTYMRSGIPEDIANIVTLPVVSHPFNHQESQQNEICSWYVQTERDIHFIEQSSMDEL